MIWVGPVIIPPQDDRITWNFYITRSWLTNDAVTLDLVRARSPTFPLRLIYTSVTAHGSLTSSDRRSLSTISELTTLGLHIATGRVHSGCGIICHDMYEISACRERHRPVRVSDTQGASFADRTGEPDRTGGLHSRIANGRQASLDRLAHVYLPRDLSPWTNGCEGDRCIWMAHGRSAAPGPALTEANGEPADPRTTTRIIRDRTYRYAHDTLSE